MSTRFRGLLVNLLVAAGVIVLVHLFFVEVPSRLADRGTSPPGVGAPPSAPEPAAPPREHGPSGLAPGILAAPDRD